MARTHERDGPSPGHTTLAAMTVRGAPLRGAMFKGQIGFAVLGYAYTVAPVSTRIVPGSDGISLTPLKA
jgi:hypothetical protein